MAKERERDLSLALQIFQSTQLFIQLSQGDCNEWEECLWKNNNYIQKKKPRKTISFSLKFTYSGAHWEKREISWQVRLAEILA